MAWISHTDAFNDTNTSNSDVINDLRLTVGVCGLVLFSVTLVILLLLLFMYKTYKTTLQRLIVYYILLSMWFAFSAAVQIVGAFTATDRRWTCIIEQYLLLSSEIAWYTYIASITTFSLMVIPCLMRGKRVSKRITECVECICVLLSVTVGLTVASMEQVYNHARGIVGCTRFLNRNLVKRRMVFMPIYFGVDLEVILVCLSLCVAFCFIRRRVHIKRTAILLRNSICHIAINASIMGLDSLRVGYSIYKWCTLTPNDSKGFLETTGAFIWNVVFLLAVVVSVIFQAVLCIQTSPHRNTCCKRCCRANKDRHLYTVIDGKDIATSPASNRVSQPSYTDFDVPYTGDFSQSTANINDGE